MWRGRKAFTDEGVARPAPKPQQVEVTPETKEELINLMSEIHIVGEMLSELLGAANEIAQKVRVDLKQHVQVVPEPPATPAEKPSKKPDHRREVSDESRRRDSPFTRRPVSEQYDWIFELLSDGQWHTSSEIAKEYATDERHFRYLKGAVNGRMGELYRMGKLERGDSDTRGSMYAYRIPPKGSGVKVFAD